jgi:recombination protein RecT
MDLIKTSESIKLELQQSKVVTPQNYSLENAMKSAYLILRETVDRNKKPALEVCSPESIHNALLQMAFQGLNPGKNQNYFVVYGQQLQCIRSYMGAQMTAKLVNPNIKDIVAQVVHADDQIEHAIINGKIMIKEHKPALLFGSKTDIIGAYAVAIDHNDKAILCEAMGMEDIKQSWKQSKVNAVAESGAINQGSTHGKFTEEMAKRTVINRLCKHIINTSDDTALLKGYQATDDERPEEEIIQEVIENNANRKLLDFDDSPQIPMATREQAEEIIKIDKNLDGISGFMGRKIEKIRELTFAQADEYISIRKAEIEQNQNSENEAPWNE